MTPRQNLSDRWDACSSPIYRVVDIDGHNVANAKLRRCGRRWIYVDDHDGYQWLPAAEAKDLLKISEPDGGHHG